MKRSATSNPGGATSHRTVPGSRRPEGDRIVHSYFNCALSKVNYGLSQKGVTLGDTVVIQGAGGLEILRRTRKKYPFHRIISDTFSFTEINEAFTFAGAGSAIRVGLEFDALVQWF